jgi:hypothetical protein
MNYFDLKKFVALIGIEDELMQLFFDKAEAAGLEPRFDKFHVLAGDEKPSPEEIEIMKKLFETHVIGTRYEELYSTADIDFKGKMEEKRKK